jgi:hypothetical protein
MVAKIIAETLIKPLYLKTHNLLRQYQQNPIVIPGSTGWQSANPQQWSPRDSMNVSLGMSVGERTRRTAALQSIMQTQMTAVQAGKDGTLVTEQNLYNTAVDLVRMAGLPDPSQYFQDPSSPQAQQAAQQKAQAAQQQAKIAQQAAQAQLQVPVSMETIKAQAAVQSAQIRAASASETQQMKNEIDGLKAALQQITDTFNARIKLAELNASLDNEPVPDTLEQMPKGNAAPQQGVLQ